jgi:pimeloyl-ACP methyl ester carboxylesterase
LRWENLTQLAERIGSIWPGSDSLRLVERAVGEAMAANLFAGASAETWSPLARIDAGQAGRLIADETLIDTYVQESEREDPAFRIGVSDRPEPRGRFAIRTVDGHPTVTLEVGGDDVGAAIFSDDAFVVDLPLGSDAFYFQYTPDDGAQRREAEISESALTSQLPDAELTTVLLWRAYFGSNTTVVDGMTELVIGAPRRILLGGVRATTLVVGRVARVIHRRQSRPRRDFSADRRLWRAEADTPQIAQACPRVEYAVNSDSPIVVAVHGTMSTAMLIAPILHAKLPAGIALYRFEHDTWLRIADNAEQLVVAMERLRVPRIVLVAHSRGGLVARHAMQLAKTRDVAEIKLVTLGTPFHGTPIVSAAHGGLLGIRALMGALRALPGGGAAIDAGTRLTGLLVKGELPVGLKAMDPDEDYISTSRLFAFADTVPFAGSIDPDGLQDSFGLAALAGLAASAFDGAANDLVVAQASASGGCDAAQLLSTDHFSYLEHPDVIKCVITQLGELKASEPPVARKVLKGHKLTIRPS